MISQLLILTDPPAETIGITWADTKVWSCPGCHAQLTSADLHGTSAESVIDHADGCTELARALAPLVASALEAATKEHRAGQDSMHADLALLLRTLGMGDHARPQSSHEVMLEAIAEVERIRNALASKSAQATHLSQLAAGFGQGALREAARVTTLRTAVERVLADDVPSGSAWGSFAAGVLRQALEATR